MKFKNFRIPNWTSTTEMTTYKGKLFLQYMKERALANRVGAGQTVVAYTHGATAVSTAYTHGVLNADGSRIYLVPSSQSTATVWHYIRTSDGVVVPYTHGATCVATAYFGGVLAPNGRIYLIPASQSTAAVWHYIDTNGTVVGYTHGATCVAGAYNTGVLQTHTGRIYLIPNGQATAAVWHYINTSTGAVVPYTHGATALPYATGVQTLDGKILMGAGSKRNWSSDTWHYINTDGTVVAYTHRVVNTYTYSMILGYDGNIYCPSLSYYFDTTLWDFVELPGGTTNYLGGTIGPNGRIYLSPYGWADEANWLYIDIDTKTAISYPVGTTLGVDKGYRYNGVLAPNGRIYLIPFYQATAAVWHYIDTNCPDTFSENILTSPYLNN